MINYHVHSDQIINSSFFKISSNKSQKSIFNKQILLNNYFSERDCKCNFKGPSMQRLPCLIYNGTLEIWSVHINVIFPTQVFISVSFSITSCKQEMRKSFSQRNRKQKYWYYNSYLISQIYCKSGIVIFIFKNTWNYATGWFFYLFIFHNKTLSIDEE